MWAHFLSKTWFVFRYVFLLVSYAHFSKIRIRSFLLNSLIEYQNILSHFLNLHSVNNSHWKKKELILWEIWNFFEIFLVVTESGASAWFLRYTRFFWIWASMILINFILMKRKVCTGWHIRTFDTFSFSFEEFPITSDPLQPTQKNQPCFC